MTIPNVNIDDAVAASLMNQIIDRLNLLDGATNRVIIPGNVAGGAAVTGIFTVPNGVTKIRISICGGGGGGAIDMYDTGSDTFTAGGAGGDSPMGDKIVVGLAPGTSISYVIGVGGKAGLFGTGAPGSGGDSNFGAYMSSTGGGAGPSGPTKGTNGTITGADVRLGNNTYMPTSGTVGYGQGGGGGNPPLAGGPGVLVVEW